MTTTAMPKEGNGMRCTVVELGTGEFLDTTDVSYDSTSSRHPLLDDIPPTMYIVDSGDNKQYNNIINT
jgi:hypothetical protein